MRWNTSIGFPYLPFYYHKFLSRFLTQKMIKKCRIFGMELILNTKCTFVNHEVNLIWFKLFFSCKMHFISIKIVSTSLLVVLGLIYCRSGPSILEIFEHVGGRNTLPLQEYFFAIMLCLQAYFGVLIVYWIFHSQE